jgi:hypothetical protein
MKPTKEDRLVSSILLNRTQVDQIPAEEITHRVARFMIEANPSPEIYALIPSSFKDEEFHVAYMSKRKASSGDSKLLTVPEAARTPAVLMATLKVDGLELRHVPAEAMTTHLILAAVADQGAALEYVPMSLRTPEIYKAALSGYMGYDAWPMIPTDVQDREDFQMVAIEAAQATGDLGDFVDTYLIKSPNSDLKIWAIQQNQSMLSHFPDLEQFDLMRLYIRRNDFPHDWFEDELPDDPAVVLKMAGNEKNKVRQVALLQSIPGASLETLVPLAKAARSDKQKNLLRRLFGSREVLMLLSKDDKARARWFSEDLNL